MIGKGSKAYDVIDLSQYNTEGMKGAWIGGVALAGGSAIIFVAFVNLFINPRLPD